MHRGVSEPSEGALLRRPGPVGVVEAMGIVGVLTLIRAEARIQGPRTQLGGSSGSFWPVLISSPSELGMQGAAPGLLRTSSSSTELVSVLRPSFLRAAFTSADG
ncbi:hypothetical protein EYF80_000417 [Liparis tanakae]|uniref:Uncharacterized protein n=1 Tax=Liparis tanakae TaxID=230148 RepID=A0A4Z2JFU4_9TELE|nr:hypothetical protein EYF80_000417 [Liparis tanakae]